MKLVCHILLLAIQDDVGVTDILTKVMQAAIVALSAYILVSIKRKSQTSVSILEYEERQSQIVGKNQKKDKESYFSSYK